MNTLYLDMDGVVADFNEYARVVHGFNPAVEYPDHEWQKLAENKRLYRDLPKTPYADDLVEYCNRFANEHNMNFMFLTAVPKTNRLHWAFYDKVLWVQRYFSFVPVHFGPFSERKQEHCAPNDILIDDRPSNIDEWNNAGGYGILHTDYDSTIESLKKYKSIVLV